VIHSTLAGTEEGLRLGISRGSAKRTGILLLGMFLYGLFFTYLGFALSTLLLLLLLSKAIGKQGWGSTILWSLFLTALAYMLFCVALKVQLPVGIGDLKGRI